MTVFEYEAEGSPSGYDSCACRECDGKGSYLSFTEDDEGIRMRCPVCDGYGSVYVVVTSDW